MNNILTQLFILYKINFNYCFYKNLVKIRQKFIYLCNYVNVVDFIFRLRFNNASPLIITVNGIPPWLDVSNLTKTAFSIKHFQDTLKEEQKHFKCPIFVPYKTQQEDMNSSYFVAETNLHKENKLLGRSKSAR